MPLPVILSVAIVLIPVKAAIRLSRSLIRSCNGRNVHCLGKYAINDLERRIINFGELAVEGDS